ncbi:hypothetical protein CEXT_219761 [Caerostris extrusa]|uniref:Uncharacterized protein n=1 Tax=Caerostris extrusa TaxID=172846 RepID=A0AAV4QPS8_CAEEX|nr:hypothetical protein CEXT_219761 [Caerostris extrusa]
MQHVRISVKIFRQQTNSCTGSKHADFDPQLEKEKNQYCLLILMFGNESEPQNLDHHIATQETRKCRNSKSPSKIASGKN